MAILPINNASIFFGGVDISGDTNVLSLGAEVEARDSTTFTTAGWRTHVGVLKAATWQFSGFVSNVSEPGTLMFNPSAADPGVVLGATTNTPIPVVATITNPAVAADVAFGMNCIRTQIQHGYTLGDLASYNLTLMGASRMLRGVILANVSAAGATASTAAQQVGAVSATQKLYASLHVTSISAGDTLDVVVESDNAVGFPSATTRITFTQVTDATTHTAQYATPVSGAITDDWWRITYTIGGAAPSFSFMVFLAIQ